MTNESSDLFRLAAAFGAAFLAGGINSVAGGGTMVSFPTLVGIGVTPLIANATNTVGIWPGSVGSVVGFWAELKRVPGKAMLMIIPASFGGLAGAVLLRMTPAGVFDWLVPWLIMFAVGLFMVQGPVRRVLERKLETRNAKRETGSVDLRSTAKRDGAHPVVAYGLQFLVGIYGGYFGAGMSIMMLALLGLLGMTDILEMNALTSLLSLGINGVAGVLFIFAGLIEWRYAGVMAIGSLVGGYGAAGVARRIGKTAIRRVVIGVGVVITIYMFWRVLGR